jgi:hypothetical protein
MQSQHCACCGQLFQPRAQTPQQTYCPLIACQRERRRHWQQLRRQKDADYRENQAQAQRAWAADHPEYWKTYRASHPEYVERNRTQQHTRDAQRKQASSDLAKMNASTHGKPLPDGVYQLRRVTSDDLAKEDAWMAEITLLSTA